GPPPSDGGTSRASAGADQQPAGLHADLDAVGLADEVAVDLDRLGLVAAHLDLAAAPELDRAGLTGQLAPHPEPLQHDLAEQRGPAEHAAAGVERGDVEPAVVDLRVGQQHHAAGQPAAVGEQQAA